MASTIGDRTLPQRTIEMGEYVQLHGTASYRQLSSRVLADK
ncbi:MAG: hypothetical protein AB4040_20230 [Synechococcus sp.]